MVSTRGVGWGTLALVTLGCGPGDVQAKGSEESAAQASPQGAAAEVPHLVGRHGQAGSLWIETAYKVETEDGRTSKRLKIDIEGAKPGVRHALALDGFDLGEVISDIKGEAEYELEEAGDDFFPEGFVPPKEGSIVHVGDLADVRLLTLHKLIDLRLDIEGPGALTGKVGYEVERLGDDVSTEFKVKVLDAGEPAVYPVMIDGVHVGDVTVDEGGKGKLVYSTLEGLPFPPDFREPKVGSKVEIGQLCEGRLRDDR